MPPPFCQSNTEETINQGLRLKSLRLEAPHQAFVVNEASAVEGGRAISTPETVRRWQSLLQRGGSIFLVFSIFWIDMESFGAVSVPAAVGEEKVATIVIDASSFVAEDATLVNH